MRERDAYSFAEAGARLAVSESTIRRMVAAGELPVIVVWGKRRITQRAIDALLTEREQAAVLPTVRRGRASVALVGRQAAG